MTADCSLMTELPPFVIQIENDPTEQPSQGRVPEWLKRVATVGTISRLASAFGIATTIVGLSWLLTPEDQYKPLAIAEPPSVSQQSTVNS